jgi:hypothetical protein
MKYWKRAWILAAIISTNPLLVTAKESIPPGPQYRIEETLVSYRGTGSNDYLAFPAIAPLAGNEVLLSYKRGRQHARDPGAVLEVIRIDLESGRQLQEPIQIGGPEGIMQMGEWIRFPNGNLATYIDVQKVDDQGQHYRTGLMRAISQDNGRSFETLESVGLIDGVEYGYLFDSVTIGQRLYALIMTFEYLAGGRRSVDALYTDDNGETWHFQRNLNHEFGDIRINESSLIPYKGGFIIATRGYDSMQRLHHVDSNFKLIQEVNITEKTPTISSHIGRPRLFKHSGSYFLIGRNHRAPDYELPMELDLIRFDPTNLEIKEQYVLDNIERGDVTDGYYPSPIIVDTGKRKLLNVFDYKAILGNSPDIIRFQFDMESFLP